MRLRMANGFSYYQPCKQNRFVFDGLSRFDDAALLVIFLVPGETVEEELLSTGTAYLLQQHRYRITLLSKDN